MAKASHRASNRSASRCLRHKAAALACIALAGCSTVGGTRDDGNDDPLEPMNRVVFNANDVVDTNVIRPLADGYRRIVPEAVRDAIRACLDNLQEPRIFVNNVLQFRLDAAAVTLARFSFNSTFGLAGLIDVASPNGLARQTGDFGQTLYRWGVGSGPYLVLPFFGPSNFRDAFGFGMDIVAMPPALLLDDGTGIWINAGVYVLSGFDLRSRNIEQLDQIKANSLDYYAQFRSIARQYREAQLRAARGLADEPEELLDPEAPAE
ncbi:MAG: VacJ family lipoprotein [Betaproteobacteria bacterium]|nr:VacJ family lipoprotein [Betaproteobacteria bacterium]